MIKCLRSPSEVLHTWRVVLGWASDQRRQRAPQWLRRVAKDLRHASGATSCDRLRTPGEAHLRLQRLMRQMRSVAVIRPCPPTWRSEYPFGTGLIILSIRSSARISSLFAPGFGRGRPRSVTEAGRHPDCAVRIRGLIRYGAE